MSAHFIIFFQRVVQIQDCLYDSAIRDFIIGAMSSGSAFRMMLVGSAYVPNRVTHTKRSDVTAEVVGAGYTAGGRALTVTAALDTTNHRETLSFADVLWPTSRINARGGVIYRARGGLASADELVAYCDFGGDRSSTGGTFGVTFPDPLTFQGP